ncbi:MAG: hypothetical protein KatS3mg111_0811 [Pirellulaceae bacterium]|nr:MAG: hypothetical protein KatS3mg111_0811 [Pirellulaceae bacterium]
MCRRVVCNLERGILDAAVQLENRFREEMLQGCWPMMPLLHMGSLPTTGRKARNDLSQSA